MLDFITLTDGYKLDHRRQYPKDTEFVYSNFTPRSSRVEGQKAIPFILLEHALQTYFMDLAQETFFSRPVKEVCDKYQDLVNSYVGPNEIGTKHIADLHELGYLPLEFRAWPEGSLVPLKMPMFTVENTHSRFFWLTNYFETLLSSVIWQGCTNAATAGRFYKLFKRAALETDGDLNLLPYQGHDFSFRGMAGPEAAARSGVGHLLYFKGTDTLPTIDLINKQYSPLTVVGTSVPATEHSVMCCDGKDGELETFARLLDLYPTGIVSIVSDTWNLWKVIDEYLPRLKDKIMSRQGKVVIRPDSGDPVTILCGDRTLGAHRLERDGVVKALWKLFPGPYTDRGFKQLDSHIGAIYGDSITLQRAETIFAKLKEDKFSSTSVVLGIGSYTYQYNTRDEYGMAMKATWAQVAGKERMLQKDPITSKEAKKSARGRIAIIGRDGDEPIMIDSLNYWQWSNLQEADLLQPVWRDGKFIKKNKNKWTDMCNLAQVGL